MKRSDETCSVTQAKYRRGASSCVIYVTIKPVLYKVNFQVFLTFLEVVSDQLFQFIVWSLKITEE